MQLTYLVDWPKINLVTTILVENDGYNLKELSFEYDLIMMINEKFIFQIRGNA